jgi:hypothetical protein
MNKLLTYAMISINLDNSRLSKRNHSTKARWCTIHMKGPDQKIHRKRKISGCLGLGGRAQEESGGE